MNCPFNKNYWKAHCIREGLSERDYLERARRRFIVLVEDCMPYVWDEDGEPRIYDHYAEALEECVMNDSVITELTLIKHYCN